MDLAEEKMNSVPTVANSIYILKTAHLTQTLCLCKGWRWTGGLASALYFFSKFIIRLLSVSQAVNITINNCDCDCEGQNLLPNFCRSWAACGSGDHQWGSSLQWLIKSCHISTQAGYKQSRSVGFPERDARCIFALIKDCGATRLILSIKWNGAKISVLQSSASVDRTTSDTLTGRNIDIIGYLMGGMDFLLQGTHEWPKQPTSTWDDSLFLWSVNGASVSVPL